MLVYDKVRTLGDIMMKNVSRFDSHLPRKDVPTGFFCHHWDQEADVEVEVDVGVDVELKPRQAQE